MVKKKSLCLNNTRMDCQPYSGPGEFHRYSDLLRAGRFGYRIPAGARFSALVQNGTWAHPPSSKMGSGSLQGVKRPGRGIDHPHQLAPRFPLGLRDLLQCALYLCTVTCNTSVTHPALCVCVCVCLSVCVSTSMSAWLTLSVCVCVWVRTPPCNFWSSWPVFTILIWAFCHWTSFWS